jgi:hypothetical protein
MHNQMSAHHVFIEPQSQHRDLDWKVETRQNFIFHNKDAIAMGTVNPLSTSHLCVPLNVDCPFGGSIEISKTEEPASFPGEWVYQQCASE